MRSPTSRPVFTGTLTAVVELMSFITQKSVCVSLLNTADLGNEMAFCFCVRTTLAFAIKFSGICLLLLILITTPCVCEAVSTLGIKDVTVPFTISAGQGELYTLIQFNGTLHFVGQLHNKREAAAVAYYGKLFAILHVVANLVV